MPVYAPCVCSAHGGQKRALDPLELEVPVVESQHVESGNQTLILCQITERLNH